jgi:DNA-binding PadR family transcriptional regulator
MARSSLTTASHLILQALASGYRYGFDIMDATGLPSGSVYPALRRFERRRLVRASWENARSAQEEGRPPRRYYELTALGEAMLAESSERFRTIARLSSLPARRPRSA